MALLSRAGSQGLFENADIQTLKHRSLHGAFITFTAQIIRFSLQLAAQIILARLLSPVDFGVIALVAPLIAFVQLFNDFGLSQAIVQRPEINFHAVSYLFWVNLLISVTLCILAASISPLVGYFYVEPRAVPVTVALSFGLILAGLSSQQYALLNRAMRFRQLAIIDMVSTAVSMIVSILAALHGLGYWSLVLMPLSLNCTSMLLSWYFAAWLPMLPSWSAEITGMLKFGRNTTGANFLNFFSRNLDNILIGKTYGTEVIGLYDRAYKLMTLPLSQINQPLQRVMMPLLSRLQDDPVRYRAAYLRTLQAIHLAAIPGMIVAIALPYETVLVLLGPKWIDAAPIFFWLAFAALTSFLGNSTGWLFASQARTASQLRWGIISAGLFVTSFLVGLPTGAVGVARAYACVGVFVQGPILWWAVTRTGPIRLYDILKTIYPFIFAGTLDFVVLTCCKRYYQFGGAAGLVAAVLISYIALASALLLLPEGRRIVHSIAKFQPFKLNKPA